MEEKLKTVKEVFKDFDFNSFALSEAKVGCVNIYKKSNTLELRLLEIGRASCRERVSKSV